MTSSPRLWAMAMVMAIGLAGGRAEAASVAFATDCRRDAWPCDERTRGSAGQSRGLGSLTLADNVVSPRMIGISVSVDTGDGTVIDTFDFTYFNRVSPMTTPGAAGWLIGRAGPATPATGSRAIAAGEGLGSVDSFASNLDYSGTLILRLTNSPFTGFDLDLSALNPTRDEWYAAFDPEAPAAEAPAQATVPPAPRVPAGPATNIPEPALSALAAIGVLAAGGLLRRRS